jgi:hypothetical protein
MTNERTSAPYEAEQKSVPEHSINDLHGLVTFIMGLSIVITGLSIIGSFWDVINWSPDSITSPIWVMAEILLMLLSIYGAYKILKTQKIGYKIIVFTRLAFIAVTYFEVSEFINSPDVVDTNYDVQKYASDILTKTVIVNIGQIIFLSLILMLRKNGRSGWDVLWRRV